MEVLSIKNLEYLHIHDEENIYMGAHQEWYDKIWQKRAGCGPTTAAGAMLYLQKKISKSEEIQFLTDKYEMLELMKEMWNYVTPGYRGVNTTSIYIRGCKEYGQKHELDLDVKHLNVLPDKKLRPSGEEVRDFITNALADDNPVAFLNLHNGEEKNLDRWHWVLLTSFDPTSGISLMYDQGIATYINIYLWLKTTIFGGGFVVINEL